MSTVSIRKTHGEDYASIKTVVDQVIADLGGLEDIIKPGYKVIIKPNLVACPTERLSGGVTRWEVCLAIYEAAKAVGGVPVIAESSAAGADTELTIAKCGYQELRDKGIPVIDLKQKENARCTVDIENGVVFNKINTWELVRDCDAIITVPVMKTHDQTEVTLGMKNLKGLLIDTQKKDFHKKGLIEGVVDWCLHLKPCLEIIDGTYGQQGLGPIFGETKKMNLIVGSKDLVACEAVTSKIMGYEPKEVIRLLNESPIVPLCVRGNCDAEVDQMVLQFPIMADYALLPLEGGHCAFVTHGHLFNTECPPPHRPGDVLIHGHTHVHCAIGQGDYTYLNPGSAALPKEGQPKSYMIYEDGLFSIRALETGEELLAWRLGL